MPIDPNNLQNDQLTFSDDFNSLSLWNGQSGTWSTQWDRNSTATGSSLSAAGVDESEWYINANGSLSSTLHPWTIADGVLTLTASPASAAVQQATGHSYTSGEINTAGSFSQTYGYFEMRAKLPAGSGWWPAFWLEPDRGPGFKPEIDVVEKFGSSSPGDTGLTTTVWTNDGGSYHYNNQTDTTDKLTDGFNTYGVDWEPDYITFYFNGKQIWQEATPSDLNTPMHMIADLAVAGYEGGTPASGASAQMQIDYIRAYASPGVSTSAATYTLGADLTAVTLTGSGQVVAGNGLGDTFHSNAGANTLIGGAGEDTFYVGTGGDQVTGNGGADTFVFTAPSSVAARITDFTDQDHISLGSLLSSLGYAGGDAVTEGYVKIAVDPASGKQGVWVNPTPGNGSTWNLLTTVEGSGASTLYVSGATVGADNGSQSVVTADAKYVAPADVTQITLSGSSAQTIIGNDLGDTIVSATNQGNTLIGGAGDDTFTIGQTYDTVTGGGGADIFYFDQIPWNYANDRITDFSGQDVIDLTGALHRAQYSSGDAKDEGYVAFSSDAYGNAQIEFNPDPGNPASALTPVITLDGVLQASLQINGTQIRTNPSFRVDAQAVYHADAGATAIALTGSQQIVYGNDGGDTFYSNNTGSTIIAGAGNDVIYAGRGGDQITTGAGADVIKFSEAPWAGRHVTDFSSQDSLDLSAMLAHYGYAGSDPVGDGTLKFLADPNGGTQVWFDADGLANAGGSWLITILDGVGSNQLQAANGVITETAASGEVWTSDANYLAPSGVTTIHLAGASAQTVTGNDAGDTFFSNNHGNTLIGGAGADTFNIGQAGDHVTGGGGADDFKFDLLPWAGAGDAITDFTAQDQIDFSQPLQNAGYTAGADLTQYIAFVDNLAGGVSVDFDPTGQKGANGWQLVLTLDHNAPTDLHISSSGIITLSSVSTSAASYTAPEGVKEITLTGTSSQTIHANNDGDIIHSTNYANTLYGGTGNDTFYVGRAGDTVTGGGGDDAFVFNENPWWGGHITDFNAGDEIDLRPTLDKASYTGSDPVADDFVQLGSDGAGNAQIFFNPAPGNSSSSYWLVATLDGVNVNALQHSGGLFTVA